MAAGGFRTFIPGEVLDEDKINDFLMQGILVFDDATARDAAITAPVEGQFVFLKDSDSVEFFDGSDFVELSSAPPEFDFLVIAGGGGGAGGENSAAGDSGGGGGAGGYRCSVSGESSGGGASAETPLSLVSGSYTVTVGAGGAGGAGASNGSSGNETFFGPIVSVGGGAGKQRIARGFDGGRGGSGGGASGFNEAPRNAGGEAITKQGFAGEQNSDPISTREGGGGGGAGEAGGTDGARQGGDGVSSSITGSAVTRGGGGGAGGRGNPGGAAGDGGGGEGGDSGSDNATAGAANTGGGGGGGGPTNNPGKAGGSGVVIIKYPDTITLTIGGGLTSSTASAGGFKVTTFTAGTDTVSF